MTLREQLRHVLPEFLPTDPSEAIKGTDLIKQIRMKLEGDYSDATLRYHFSILCYDPSSPIAKVDQGQGYYQRQARRPASLSPSLQGWFGNADGEEANHWMRLDRVLAICERSNLLNESFPFVLNGRGALEPKIAGDWEVPDLVLAEWDLQASGEGEEARFDRAMMDLRRHVGAPEVSVTGVQVKLSPSLESYNADFFQALSATRWTERSELVLAENVTDEALVDALRRLGHQYGVGIVSLGIPVERLDEMALGDEIRALESPSFDKLQSTFNVQRLTQPVRRGGLEWTALSRLRSRHEAIGDLVDWLAECLESGSPQWHWPQTPEG